MQEFYTLVTTIGHAQIANAVISGSQISLTEIALGSGDIAEVASKEAMTALVSEVWRGPIATTAIDADKPNHIIVEAVIPADQGGWEYQEAGVFDDTGNLIAVARLAKTYKPANTSGGIVDTRIKLVLQVSNADAVSVAIDPTVVIASRQYVDETIATTAASQTQLAANLLRIMERQVLFNERLNELER